MTLNTTYAISRTIRLYATAVVQSFTIGSFAWHSPDPVFSISFRENLGPMSVTPYPELGTLTTLALRILGMSVP